MRTWLVTLFLMAALQAHSAQPTRFNYQALLRDGDGALLEGQHTLHVGLYEGGSAGVVGSGDLLYGETAIVTAADGVVNHVIGAGTPTGAPLDADDLATSATVFVQIAVDLPANVVLPRTPLQSVPYAVQSAHAETANSANSALNGVPSGTMILGTSPNAPDGFTSLGTTLYAAWQTRANIPAQRSYAAAAAVGGKLYVIGGTVGGPSSSVNECYSPDTNAWTTATAIPTGRQGHTCTEIGGLIYAVGGFKASTVGTENESYDPSANAWTPRQPLSGPRYHHAAAAVNGRLYVCGGQVTGGAGAINTVEEYNPAADEWVSKASMLTSRTRTAAAAVNGKIYVMGGYTQTTMTAANEEYDPVGDVWTPRAPMPIILEAHVAVSHAGRIYVTGGINFVGVVTAEVLIYDPATDTWTLGPPMPAPRAAASSAICENLLYVVSGAPSQFTLSPNTYAWPPGVYFPYVKD